jgi:hypothetical protein
MASADELRARLGESRQGFRAALETAGPNWSEEPENPSGEEEWSPQRVAQHAIGAEVYFANKVSETMLGKPAAFERAELGSHQMALEALERAIAVADRAYKYVEDRDLEKPMEVAGGFPQTIGGSLMLAAHHLSDHASQIRTAGGS